MAIHPFIYPKVMENPNENRVLEFLFFWIRPIRVGEISRELQIKHSTLNSILKRLQEQEYIIWEKYKLVSLSSIGKGIAEHLTNHHFIIEQFLKKSLHIESQFAHDQALQLAGIMSCELINAICERYDMEHDEMDKKNCECREYK